AYEVASGQKFEGIISKKAQGTYHHGRSEEWRKTKRIESEEFAVVGATPGKGARQGIGSLLLARPDPKHGWVYAGRVGTGFSGEQLRELEAHIGNAGGSKPTVHIPKGATLDAKGAAWFDPMFVVEVFIRGISNTGVLRQASLKAIRLDKDPADLRDGDQAPEPERPPVKISSPTKVIYPDRGITKGEVAEYYQAVMEHILPGIIDRPLSIIRCPNGAGKACFFQKHHTPGLERVDLVRLKEEAGNNANYLVVRDEQGLMELVQLNGLEFHPWGSTAEDPDRANRVVFDLDPGPGVPFAEGKKAAQDVRRLLGQMELESFLRTTGGKGLHVVVPLSPGCEWDLVKSFAGGFAEALAQTQPQRFLAVSTLKLRPGKIFVDYLRNGRGATAVASYSLRARDGAPVAMPISWSELTRLKSAQEFDIKEVPKRLKRRRKDPWEGIARVEQDLGRWSAG